MRKRRYLSDQEKANLINEFNRIPNGRTGERGEFKEKHRLTWTLMNSWKKMPGVKKLLLAPSEQKVQQAADSLPIPLLVPGQKRQFDLRQKAWLVASYLALPFGSDARGIFCRKHGIHYNMIGRWKAALKREGIPLPNVKVGMTMNGATPDIVVESPGAKRPYVRKAKLDQKPEKQARFESVHDAIAYMEIRREIEDRILEELKQHAGKTRDV